MKLNLSIVARVLILVTLLQGTGLPQSIQQCTLSNGIVTGPFGGYDVSGTFSGPAGGVPTTSSITVNGPGIPYSYTFSGPLNGTGYTQPSQIPPPPCILGCPPGGNPPGYASLHVYLEESINSAALAFTDSGEPFNGSGFLSCKTVGGSSPPPPPETCGVSDPIWSQIAWTGTCPGEGPSGPQTNVAYVRGQKINVYWGKPFGSSTSLTSVLGETLELWCGALPGSNEYQYLLFFTPLNDTAHEVGYCAWQNGCNSARFSYSSVFEGPNGPQPSCFQDTTWISKDYGANDSLENPPLLDWLVEEFSANTLQWKKTDLQFLYKYGPPVPLCSAAKPGEPPPPPPEGKFVKGFTVDPQIGPATDAYVLSVMDELATQPPGVAAPASTTMADINGDGVVNMADFTAFKKAFGSCTGQPNYSVYADLDFDGCVTLKDYQIWLQLYNAATAK